jgi:hypothetical protein
MVFAACMSPEVALNCRAAGADQCPKLGVERTQSGHAATAVSDPERSLRSIPDIRRSVRFDVREFDDLAPFLRFIGQERAKFGG